MYSSPIPLKWQLTDIHSPQFMHQTNKIDTIGNYSRFRQKLISNLQMILLPDNMVHIFHILDQFGTFNDYDRVSNIVINGYIRNIQKNITSIIPMDIYDVCASFYFQNEDKYIHLGYKLYHKINESNIKKYSGKQLISIIENICLTQHDSKENMAAICNNLIKYRLIEIVSFKTSFSSLFKDKSDGNALFNGSENFVYKLTNGSTKIFKEYSIKKKMKNYN